MLMTSVRDIIHNLLKLVLKSHDCLHQLSAGEYRGEQTDNGDDNNQLFSNGSVQCTTAAIHCLQPHKPSTDIRGQLISS